MMTKHENKLTCKFFGGSSSSSSSSLTESDKFVTKISGELARRSHSVTASVIGRLERLRVWLSKPESSCEPSSSALSSPLTSAVSQQLSEVDSAPFSCSGVSSRSGAGVGSLTNFAFLLYFRRGTCGRVTSDS